MTDNRHLALGEAGEDMAAAYLAEKGYTIVERRVRFRRGELDIVAKKGGEWIFIEVKTRSAAPPGMGGAVGAMTWRKSGRMAYAVKEYVRLHGLERAPIRCDLVAIDIDARGEPDINHYPASIRMA